MAETIVIFLLLVVGGLDAVNVCKDSDDYTGFQCNYYKNKGYCELTRKNEAYLPFMSARCNKTCGFCVENATCTDSPEYAVNCPEWRGKTFCEVTSKNPYHGFMMDHCQVTCGYCFPEVDLEPKCENSPELGARCVDWEKEGFCKNEPGNDQYAFMMSYCKGACGCPDKTKQKVKCGLRLNPRGKVVGGVDVQRNSWPWQARFELESGEHHCGGALIDNEWILTAAHCFEDRVLEHFGRVVLGDHVRSIDDSTEQEFKISKFIMHPDFNGLTMDSDITLVKLSKPAEYNEVVSPICLPEKNEAVQDDRYCTVTGWGYTVGGGFSSEVLQQAELLTVQRRSCRLQNSPREGYGFVINNNTICAGENDEGNIKSACQGDSGGPFVCATEEDVWKIQGVVSWGDADCSIQSKYSVFARVSKFIDWIKKTIKEK